MAEATTTEITVTPKQLGKHLRSVRRKKGLSLSEVARGAGLSRRELVAYERGKVPIPESDLWVLAGSCGVDVAELLPTNVTKELSVASPAPSTIGDAVTQLRRTQEDAGITPYLHTLQKLQALPPGKRIPVKERELEAIAVALGSTPRSIEEKLQEVLHVSPDEAERLRAMILVPPSGRGKPRALAAAPSSAPTYTPVSAPTPAPATEPEPQPEVFSPDGFAPAAFAPTAFGTDPGSAPETSAEPDEVLQTFPAAPAAFSDAPLDAPIDPVHGHNVDVFEELARLPEPVPLGDPSAPLPDLLAPQDPFEMPPLVGAPTGPPEGAVELVDSAMTTPGTVARTGSSPDATPWTAADAPPIDVAMREGGSATWNLGQPPLAPPTRHDATAWETSGWQPPAPDGAPGAPGGFWEGTDDWTPPPSGAPHDDTPVAHAGPAETVVGPMHLGEDTWAGSAWDLSPWTPADPQADAGTDLLDDRWSTGWPNEETDEGAWDHTPDPAAVNSGFFVDWGTPETEAPPGLDAFAETAVPEAHTDQPADHTADDATWASPFGTVAPADHEVVEAHDETATLDREPASADATAADESVEVLHHDEPSDATAGWAPFPAHEFAAFDPAPPADSGVEAAVEHVVEAPEPPEPLETEAADSAEALEPVDEIVADTEVEVETPDVEVEPVDEIDADADLETDQIDQVDDIEIEPVDEIETEPLDVEELVDETDAEPVQEIETEQAVEVEVEQVDEIETEPLDETEVEPATVAADEALPPISWRADTSVLVEEALSAGAAIAAAAFAAPWAPAADGDEREGEAYVTAGPDWQLGNALPLVEVQAAGSLVMRRADERWALADLTTTPDFAVEVDVDFRSGPGFGVLFLASVDDEGRMSGYSFDIDPIYDGGGYLVRQWHGDRELWNPIARVGGTDPAAMYGRLTVRLVVDGDRLCATVNGTEVLTVDDLRQASADRGRDAAAGNRVGVQAWSSSDLVIDTLRVAAR
jgi:transcriptional regulator with XRE-family HTH domain